MQDTVDETKKQGDDKNKPSTTTGKESAKERIRRIKALYCYNCGERVTPDTVQCPKCGATADGFNPNWILRVVLGVVIGMLLWAIFW